MAHAVLAHMLMWGSEWEAAIAEARIAVGLNPNNAFVISMLGCTLTFGGYYDEALDRLEQAMRASPHDPLTWLWVMWSGAAQFSARRFDAVLETYGRLNRLRPEYGLTQALIAAALASLGRLEDARDLMARARLLFGDPWYRERPPWIRPEDYALRNEALRLVPGEAQ